MGSHLDVTIGFPGDFDDSLCFVGIVATGFFDIDVLPRATSGDGRRGVPEVGGCYGNSINVRVVEYSSKIGDQLWSLVLLFLHRVPSGSESIFIDITEVGDFGIGNIEVTFDVSTTATQSHHPDAKSRVCAFGLT